MALLLQGAGREMSFGDIIALLVCTFSLVVAIVTSAIWLCNKLEKLALAVANSVTHDQCSQKRDNCPCVKDIAKIEDFLNEKHPRS
jgi:hypothetical protein